MITRNLKMHCVKEMLLCILNNWHNVNYNLSKDLATLQHDRDRLNGKLQKADEHRRSIQMNEH